MNKNTAEITFDSWQIDEELSTESLNPVQNKVVTEVVSELVSKEELLNLIYPVGAIYMSVNDVSPQTFLGGTWERFGEGRMPMGGSDTVESELTGGSETHSHGLEGTGFAKILQGTAGISSTVQNSSFNSNATLLNHGSLIQNGTCGNATALGGTTNNTNTLPPYIITYMWKRTL